MWRELLGALPERENDEQHAADDDERDDGGALPAAGRRLGQGQRDEDERKGSAEQDNTADIEISPDFAKGGKGAAARGRISAFMLGAQTKLLRAAGVEAQREREREEDDGQDDGPDAVGPAPGGGGDDGAADDGADPGGHEEGDVGEAREEGAVQHVARVGDEDLLQDLEARRPGRVEDLRRRERLHVGRRRHLYVTEHVQQDAEAVRLQPAEDVGDLGHRWFDHGCGRRKKKYYQLTPS